MINYRQLKSGIKSRLHHIVFMISLLSLSLLITWWSFFIYRSIEQNYHSERKELQYKLDQFVLELELSENLPLLTGSFPKDNRFEIVRSIKNNHSLFSKIPGETTKLYLAVREEVLKEMDKSLGRKKLMVFGESGLLVIVIVVSIIFLFKFIDLEKRSTQELEEFWGRISHEIKTPITGIKSFLESLRAGSINPEKLPKFIDLALKQIEKQEQLAGNILTGSSFKSNIKLNMEEFDLNDFLKLYLNEHSIGLSDKKLKYDYAGDVNLIVCGDKYAFKIILDNIIDNAEKYSSHDLVLSMKTLKTNKSGVVIIKDNGPGFTPDCAENIFRAYKYMKEKLPKTSHGTGMGLYISRKLARQMGGDISASSDGEGSGAIFRVELSLVK